MAVVYESETKQISYKSPDEQHIKEKCNALVSAFIKYAKVHGLTIKNVYIQRILLPRIVLRVDKRESYFLIYHKQTKINEIKQAALIAYWILKFKPFMVISDDPVIVHKFTRINEGFAAFYLLSSLKQYSIEKGCVATKMSDHLRDELMYAFTYWDLSKEALILIAETIGEAFYGIEAQGMDSNGCNE